MSPEGQLPRKSAGPKTGMFERDRCSNLQSSPDFSPHSLQPAGSRAARLSFRTRDYEGGTRK